MFNIYKYEDIYFLFLIAIYTLSLKSQTKGSVIDGKDNYPLSGVNIYMQRDSVGIGITDETGYFNVANIEKFAGMIQLYSRI